MTTRLHATLLIAAAMLAGALTVQGLADVRTALADDVAVVDAGAAAKSLETGAPVPPAVEAPTVQDPTVNPSGYAQDVVTAFRAGRWAFLVVLCLFGLARVLLWAATRWSLTWLKRWAPVLVTSSGVLASVAASLSAVGAVDWWAVIGAGLAALTLYLVPQPKAARPA